MTKEYPYLTDKEFLLKVDNLQMREHYLKIYILDWKTEKPIDVLEGLVTSTISPFVQWNEVSANFFINN